MWLACLLVCAVSPEPYGFRTSFAELVASAKDCEDPEIDFPDLGICGVSAAGWVETSWQRPFVTELVC